MRSECTILMQISKKNFRGRPPGPPPAGGGDPLPHPPPPFGSGGFESAPDAHRLTMLLFILYALLHIRISFSIVKRSVL